MKRLILIIAVLAISALSSFAYHQKSVTTYGGTNGIYITINANCSYVTFETDWYGGTDQYSYGHSQAYSSSYLIGDHYWAYGGSYPSHQTNTVFNQYWGNISLNIFTNNCTGTAILKWEY